MLHIQLTTTYCPPYQLQDLGSPARRFYLATLSSLGISLSSCPTVLRRFLNVFVTGGESAVKFVLLVDLL